MTPKRKIFLWILALSLLFIHSRSDTATFDPTPLLTSNTGAFSINTAISASGSYGTQVINAGDVDGDGKSDIVVAVPTIGRVYVIYGEGDLTVFANMDITNLAQAKGVRILAAAVGDLLGASISAGDVNKDGKSDIIIGAPGRDNGAGAVYVVYGAERSAHLELNLVSYLLTPSSSGFMIKGNPNELLGSAVGATDVNGDNYVDIIIGAPGKNGYTGAAYVIYGKGKTGTPSFPTNMENLLLSSLDLASTGFVIKGSNSGDRFGSSVGAAGKINNDAYNDIVIGAPNKNTDQGAAYVIYGAASFPTAYTNLDLTTLDLTGYGFMIVGKNPSDQFGSSCGNAGDMNKDTKNDIFVAAIGKGAVYVIYGKTSGAFSKIDLSAAPLSPTSTGFVITGDPSSSNFGFSVAKAGDITGDGAADLLIGAPSNNKVFVIYGDLNQDIDLTTTDLDPLVNGFAIAGPTGSAKFGSSVAVETSWTLNGKSGFLIGAQQVTSSARSAYVIFSSKMCADHCIDCNQVGTCTQCDTAAGYNLVNSVCSKCDAGKYLNSGGTCSDCPTGCSACFLSAGGGGVTCTACFNGYYFTVGVCNLCPVGCSTCSDASTCAVCSPGYKKIASKCCKNECATCSDGSTCTSCPVGFGLKMGGCVTCSATEFLAADGTCQVCSSLCSGCAVNASGCTSCPGSKVLVVTWNACEDSCPDGTYLLNGKCETCDLTTCAKCENSPTTCTSCNGAMVLENSLCQNSCSPGKYNLNGVCQACDNSCATCNGAGYSACMSCHSGEFLYSTLFPAISSSCVFPCPDGFFPSSATGKCENCVSPCATCSSTSACNSCPGSLFLVVPSSSCLTACPGNTYLAAPRRCEACDTSCATCNGAGSSSCASCSGTLVLHNSQCIPSCPAKFYAKNGKCENCPSPCDSCLYNAVASTTTCVDCISGFGLYMNQCRNPCPDGTYLASSGKCEDCSVGCAKCTSSSTCTACDSSLFLYHSSCITSCPDGTYSAKGKCQDCPGTCSKCIDLSHCTACETDFGLIKSQCVACPLGTYLQDEKCKGCPLGCSKCKSDLICEACHGGYTLSSSHLCETKEVENGREKAAGDTFEGSSIAGAALASGSSLPINFGLVAKIIRNLKYLNVTVSTELQETFVSWKVSGGFLKAPQSWRLESSSKPLPGVFSRYGLDPVFLINYWKPLILTLIGIVLFVAFKIMETGLNKNDGKQDPLKTSIPRKLNLAASNFALTQIYSNMDDVIFYFIIDARSTSLDGAFRGFSLALAVVLLLFGCAILGFHGFLLKKYQSLKRDKAQTDTSLKRFLYKYENVKLIFQDFKDTTLLTQSFLWIHLVRALISSLIFTTLFEYPLAQALLLLVLNVGMIVFIGLRSPFKDILGTCSQLFCEIILFLANVCMLAMAIFDQAGSYPIDAIKHLSRGVIVLNAILLFGSAILMVIGILKEIYLAYQAKKKPPQQKIPHQLMNNRIMTNANKLNSTYTDSAMLQQNSSAVDYTRNYEYDPRQNYSQPQAIGANTTFPSDPNVQNQLEISDLADDMNISPVGNQFNQIPQNNYQGFHQENNFRQQFESNTIDETMMNTSNIDLLQHSSPMKTKPRIRGKIKMPGGVEINPRGTGMNLALELQGSSNIPYNNPRPSNMDPNRNQSGFESQSRSPEQKRNGNSYEEYILERTRSRVKYHNSRSGRFPS